MPQISTIGSGGTYTTISAWAAAESGIDYGDGNPAIGEFLELLNENVAITGVFVRGYILRAALGLELDKSNLTTAVGNSNDTRPNISTPGALAEFKNIIVSTSAHGSTTDMLYEDCYLDKDFKAQGKKVTMRRTIHKGMSRALDASSNNAFALAENCTAIDNTGTFAFVRFHCTNCLSIGGAAAGFAATVSGSDFNSSDDTTAPGSNSLHNRTTEDLVSYAGGDYRASDVSALATGGVGGTFIGFAVKVGSGIVSKVGSIVSSVIVAAAMSGVKVTHGNALSAVTQQSNITANKSAYSTIQSTNNNNTLLSGSKSSSGYIISQVIVSSTISGYADSLIRKSGFALSSTATLSITQGIKSSSGYIDSTVITNTTIDGYKSGKGLIASTVTVTALSNGFKCSFGTISSVTTTNTNTFGYTGDIKPPVTTVTIQGSIVQATIRGSYQTSIIIKGALNA